MSDDISQKQFDCDHQCTYDSDRPRQVCTETPEGDQECKTGYRHCVDECMSESESESA